MDLDKEPEGRSPEQSGSTMVLRFGGFFLLEMAAPTSFWRKKDDASGQDTLRVGSFSGQWGALKVLAVN